MIIKGRQLTDNYRKIFEYPIPNHEWINIIAIRK